MSVQSEITRLTSAKTDIAAAIKGKGVAVPDGTALDGMAELIEEIPTVELLGSTTVTGPTESKTDASCGDFTVKLDKSDYCAVFVTIVRQDKTHEEGAFYSCKCAMSILGFGSGQEYMFRTKYLIYNNSGYNYGKINTGTDGYGVYIYSVTYTADVYTTEKPDTLKIGLHACYKAGYSYAGVAFNLRVYGVRNPEL